MPWRTTQVAPYLLGEEYVPSTTERFYYSDYQRTPQQMARAYEQAIDAQEARNQRDASRPANNQGNWRDYVRPGYR
jgi:hypothetical protein